ncbi:MAG: hypothetical protein AAGA48_28600 [Myxococcota bacterium]
MTAKATWEDVKRAMGSLKPAQRQRLYLTAARRRDFATQPPDWWLRLIAIIGGES